MFTRQTLFKQLAAMQVPQNVPVLCHTSLRAVGEVEGRGEGFLEALIDYVTADGGILLIPTHTWANVGKDCVTMDVTSPETCIGTLPSIAAVHPKAHRSLHPTHSMAAFGDNAEEFIAGECMVDSSTSPRGCHGRLWERGGKILLIGVGHNRNTYLHAVEELMQIPGRMSDALVPATIRLKDGSVIERPIHCHDSHGLGDISRRYPKYEEAFRHHGCITDGLLGAAKTQLCDCVKMRDVMLLIRERSGGAELLADDEPIPQKYWR
ncbi:MAG: AAC(3) family N-acetyltransferase [Clostridia bacterium]|nr:AAC(3) family N-acetyltransferase [Clostridia bacterium]